MRHVNGNTKFTKHSRWTSHQSLVRKFVIRLEFILIKFYKMIEYRLLYINKT